MKRKNSSSSPAAVHDNVIEAAEKKNDDSSHTRCLCHPSGLLPTNNEEKRNNNSKKKKKPVDDEAASTTTTATETTASTIEQILVGRIKNGQLHYLTGDGASWYILAREWMPCRDKADFQREWDLHPRTRHKIKIFGREMEERRWSQSWGVNYAYSGTTNPARPINESSSGMVQALVQKADEITQGLYNPSAHRYNGCLQNWYTPDDTIGLHSDDEKMLVKSMPIFSLSWGGTRRFLLRYKKKGGNKKSKIEEIYLNDGDLIVMGGTIQETHKHEVPKVRKTMDTPTSNRINWTIRAFHSR